MPVEIIPTYKIYRKETPARCRRFFCVEAAKADFSFSVLPCPRNGRRSLSARRYPQTRKHTKPKNKPQ